VNWPNARKLRLGNNRQECAVCIQKLRRASFRITGARLRRDELWPESNKGDFEQQSQKTIIGRCQRAFLRRVKFELVLGR
jgi:hypothetical protein